ncbi:hypothetical protein J437_LFUL008415 [Ladona fulva]|uniref:U8 snoRNA-decapping enzyme n=1 Tax=Ladona fulva TaxID=123851 RepID=A0A8K0K3Z1_LADFU|nr:hypothetical protein J437_LFUL008415 [Ladona fulva]
MEETGDNTWGHLASTSHFGSPSVVSDHITLRKEDIGSEKYKNYTHASHCMLYAKNNDKAFGIYKRRATILMHLRFDGMIGFPGGLVDDGENFLDAVNRELREEIHLDTSKYPIEEEHHIISHEEPNTQLCLHFYAREIEPEDLHNIEKNCLNANEFGEEVMGTFRVPLYTMGGGHRSRQDVPTSDEDSLNDNASVYSVMSECGSVMVEGTNEEVDEQTQEEVFEEKLKESIDGINQKSAQGRTSSLESVSKAFVQKFIPDFILDRRLTLTDGIERCLRKGRGAEQASAANLAALLCVQLGGGDECGLGGDGAGGSANQAFRDLRPVLTILATDNAASYPARAKCCMALGLCSFVSNGELQDVVELMCTLENIFWLAASSSVQASNPEAAVLYSSALSAWALLLTLMSPHDVYSLMGRQMDRLVLLLSSSYLDVRIAAGEAIAVATELGRAYDADFTIGPKDCDDDENLLATLHELATDSHKYRAKKDRKQQRSSFRDILHFVEEGIPPDVQVKFGQEMLLLDSWCRKKQYDAFCQVLGPGMNLHLTENYLLREIFKLGERVTLLNGAMYKASKLERDAVPEGMLLYILTEA